MRRGRRDPRDPRDRRVPRGSRGWYARALALLPRDFVEEFGEAMEATYEARAADTRARGRAAYARHVARELAGLVHTAVTERLRARTRDATLERRVPKMEHTWRELAHAARRLWRTPGFTGAAVLTLALAIGANTALFTLVQRAVLAPLPYPAADALVALDHAAPGLQMSSGLGMTTGLYREYAALPSVASIAVYVSIAHTLSGDGDAERVAVLIPTPSLSDVLGVAPALGRWFTAEEGERGGPGVAILTHAFWQTRFGADPAVLGRTLRLDGNVYEIIGVMPRGFAFPDERPQVILPLQLDLAAARPGGFNFMGVARLAPGATVAQLRHDQNAVIGDLAGRFPEHAGIVRMIDEIELASLAKPLKDHVLGETTRTLWVLLGAAGIVLLIACANVANLFLVRLDARRREVAVRRALGAGRARIAGYFMAETALVCGAAGALGLLVGYFAVEVIRTTSLVRLPRLHEVHVDGATIAFAGALALAAGLAFGVMPLLRRLPGVAAVLQDAGRGNSAGAGRMRVRHGLMAVQVALAVMLLVAAGLLVRSFEQLRSVQPGFAAEQRLVFRVGLSETVHRDNASTAAFHERLLERVEGMPGVAGAAIATTLPLEGDGWGDPFEVRGRPPLPGEVQPIVRVRRVSAAFFETLEIPLRQGPGLTTSDASGATKGAVINHAFAEQYFPGEDPIGREVRTLASGDDGWLTIVGVAANTATYGLREDAAVAKLYVSLRSATEASLPSLHNASYVVRTTGEPLALVPALRRALAEIDPNVALARAEPLTELLARARSSLAFTMLLLVTAAALAALLGVIGVYAVISYGVAQRRTEIAVRLALGAQPGDVTRMIARQSGAVIAFGVVAGIAGAVASARLLGALLFGVAWHDPATYLTVAAGLFAVAMLACWVPARRAARLDPLRGLQ